MARQRIVKMKRVQVTSKGRVVNLRPTFQQLFRTLSSDEQLAFRCKYNMI